MLLYCICGGVTSFNEINKKNLILEKSGAKFVGEKLIGVILCMKNLLYQMKSLSVCHCNKVHLCE